jgi:hypothetical protein
VLAGKPVSAKTLMRLLTWLTSDAVEDVEIGKRGELWPEEERGGE